MDRRISLPNLTPQQVVQRITGSSRPRGYAWVRQSGMSLLLEWNTRDVRIVQQHPLFVNAFVPELRCRVESDGTETCVTMTGGMNVFARLALGFCVAVSALWIFLTILMLCRGLEPSSAYSAVAFLACLIAIAVSARVGVDRALAIRPPSALIEFALARARGG